MPEPEVPDKRPTLFTCLFGATRYVMTVAVLLIVGIMEIGGVVWHANFAGQASGTESVSLRVAVIEAVDVILVATVLFVIAFGLYQLFEGRDAAGKGGNIKGLTERTSQRVFRVVALASPTEREKSQMYIQLYIPHLPAGGEIVLFDRSWYNRAGVERVMGFATEEQVESFLKNTRGVEQAIINSGVILVKYWLEETMEDQTERFTERIEDYRKIWKLSPMDLESHRRWYDYSRARDAMFAATDTPESPWYVFDLHDQRRGRLNCITHLLSLIPYEEVPHEKVKLPKRQSKGDYVEPDYPFRRIPEKY